MSTPLPIHAGLPGKEKARTHITVRGLSKAFGGQPLYQNFDLDLPRGKVITFFGPNGCGKSTLINLICGLIRPDAGEVLFDGKTLRQTVIGYVFQNYRDALFPWLSARDNIIRELYPAAGEIVIDKPGKGSFYATDLEHILRTLGITHLMLSGITTDVCVHTTMREANDRGFECLMLTDGTGATDYNNHLAAISMIGKQGGVFGATSDSTRVVAALQPLISKKETVSI